MKKLTGKKVQVRELNYSCANRDGGPEEVTYEGIVKTVAEHMIELHDCHIVHQQLSRSDPGVIWFNTMASAFQSITLSK